VGTNKADAKETVELLWRDAEALRARRLTLDVDELCAARGLQIVDLEAYRRIDAVERARGAARGKVRDKLERVADMLAAAFPKA
jgi:hypothetical protein